MVDWSDVTSMQATRLQRTYDTLTELFDRVGLHTNVAKTLIMDFQPCHALGGHSEESHRLQMTGEGKYSRYRLIQTVHCPDCDVNLATGSQAAYQQVQHGVARGDLMDPPPYPLDNSSTYRQ